MGIADSLASPEQPKRPRAQHPKGFEPGVRREGSEVVVAFTEIPEDEQKWRAEIERVTGLPLPPERRVTLSQVRYWGDPKEPQIYCRFLIEDRAEDSGIDIEGLVQLAKTADPPAAREPSGKALVVAWADLQVGKVGSRGGTEELITRVMSKLDLLDAHAAQIGADTVYLIDCGDCVESFENTPAQQFTNDLSFPEQLRVARRLFTEAALRLARTHSKVVVTGVPSNHGKWRRGKDALGKPGDDYGIEQLVTMSDAFSLNAEALGHVSFVVPDTWQESLALDINGTILAVAHGHQTNNPNQVPLWWAKQVFGGQPAADADILLTGHYHHLRVEAVGRSQHTQKSRWWIQAPTLDNGSDWFRLRAGSDSDPGLLVFTVDADGWDGLKIL